MVKLNILKILRLQIKKTMFLWFQEKTSKTCNSMGLINLMKWLFLSCHNSQNPLDRTTNTNHLRIVINIKVKLIKKMINVTKIMALLTWKVTCKIKNQVFKQFQVVWMNLYMELKTKEDSENLMNQIKMLTRRQWKSKCSKTD